MLTPDGRCKTLDAAADVARAGRHCAACAPRAESSAPFVLDSSRRRRGESRRTKFIAHRAQRTVADPRDSRRRTPARRWLERSRCIARTPPGTRSRSARSGASRRAMGTIASSCASRRRRRRSDTPNRRAESSVSCSRRRRFANASPRPSRTFVDSIPTRWARRTTQRRRVRASRVVNAGRITERRPRARRRSRFREPTRTRSSTRLSRPFRRDVPQRRSRSRPTLSIGSVASRTPSSPRSTSRTAR